MTGTDLNQVCLTGVTSWCIAWSETWVQPYA
jgi:hypothetical protein